MVRKYPRGGDEGKSADRTSLSWKYLDSYGVPAGPAISACGSLGLELGLLGGKKGVREKKARGGEGI